MRTNEYSQNVAGLVNLADQRRSSCGTIQCYFCLYSFTRALNVRTVIEIGTHRGLSACIMCQAILDNGYEPSILTIDNWNDSKSQERDNESAAKDLIRTLNFKNYIRMITGDSKEFLKSFTSYRDLVYIDGDHRYDAVVSDFELSKNITSNIIFHDVYLDKDTTQGDNVPHSYIEYVRSQGWNIVCFPTRASRHKGGMIGIAVARRSQ